MSGDAAKRPEDSRAAPLRNPNFRLLMGFRIFTILSYQGVAVTVGWHVYELTRDPWMLGLIGLAEVLPYFCVAPFAGYLVDVLPRRRLGAFAAACLAITPLLLASIAAGWWASAGIAAIYVAVALTGCVRAFLGPVYNALFARALKRGQFARGASIGSVVFQTGLVLGPAIGGVLIGVIGKSATYALAATFAIAAAIAFVEARRNRRRAHAAGRPNGGARARRHTAGIQYAAAPRVARHAGRPHRDDAGRARRGKRPCREFCRTDAERACCRRDDHPGPHRRAHR